MTTTLVCGDGLAADLAELAAGELEAGAVLIARHVRTLEGGTRLLARSLHEAPESAYVTRAADELVVTSDAYIAALRLAEEAGCLAIWIHSHPNGDARFSEKDAHVDDQLAETFRIRTRSRFYGAIVVALQDGDLQFSGHLLEDDEERVDIERLWITGDRWKLIHSQTAPLFELDTRLDRNVRAFGGAVQRTLADMTIAVIGAGGTGSAVAEQLARIGAGKLVLCDLDTLNDSNVTRVYGSRSTDVGLKKVDILRDHLTSIIPNLEVRTIDGSVAKLDAARRLVDADVIFGCTDDNAGRVVLSRMAVFYDVPLIDVGVILDSDENECLRGIYERVTVVTRGTACLICRGRVDLARAQSEGMTAAERQRRADEGYAPALPGVEPAVVSFTTMAASFAVTELLERLIGFGAEPRPSELLIRVHDREVSSNIADPRPRHYCSPSQGFWGRGDVEPFLERTWPE